MVMVHFINFISLFYIKHFLIDHLMVKNTLLSCCKQYPEIEAFRKYLFKRRISKFPCQFPYFGKINTEYASNFILINNV